MRTVVALGGNALLPRGERPDAAPQADQVRRAAAALAPLAACGELVVTHGNGPQVGLLALESAGDPRLSRPYPFDVLGAETQGMIGYWLLQALHNALPDRRTACLLNQTVVDRDDPAFARPTKFVGAVLTEAQAREQRERLGWDVGRDGEAWRRVVPSPEPVSVVEADLVGVLLEAGAVVVCGGGGGIPVVIDESGRLSGVEAVVDKDLTAALLAEQLKADTLLILTDVPYVELDHGTPRARPLRETTPRQLGGYDFLAGSMGPKTRAAARFVERTGGRAVIGRLADAREILAGTAGTRVTPDAG
ncbi:carbamate kinase [Streptomyces malaysiense]|uniref:Carbamate kinase n=1 Tax=Streptomyces malaysiense TaxID=1428626 RepID=A0A1J4PX06_9ACTN|nr:carbamate kinase [Streptomyces malaysiense]OIK25467.1 carbamate kinase [Streptomyces malaysiense]